MPSGVAPEAAAEARGPSSTRSQPAVLLVDDEEPILGALARLLRREPFRILTARSGEEGLAAVADGPVAVVLSDHRMPGMAGVELLNRVRETSPDTVRILLTGFADLAAAIAAINEAQVFRFLPKPWEDEDLRLTIRQAFRHYALTRENRRLGLLAQEQNDALRTLNAALEQRVAERTRELAEQLEKVRETQARLVRAERLAAVGELVAGVAHELNNPLTSVLGLAELLGAGTAEPEARRRLESLHGEALRCARIVQGLLAFARQRPPERRACRINDLLAQTVEVRAYHLRVAGVRVTLDLAPDLPETLADPHQLQQVFLNLLNNAHQAMERQGGGELTIGSRTVRTAGAQAEAPGGPDHICIVFEDTGPGIPPELRERIFEPFFTTKPPGEGTGLGLSICYGIVREHGGEIRVEERARGARLVLDLPVVRGIAGPAAVPDPDPAQAGVPQGTRILLVDDESALLAACRELLERDGVLVSTASSGGEALRHLAAAEYDLVISDIKMPGMDGRTLHREIRRRYPALARRVLFISGDARTQSQAGPVEWADAPLLPKPFGVRDLRAAVRRVLEGGPALAPATACPGGGHP